MVNTTTLIYHFPEWRASAGVVDDVGHRGKANWETLEVSGRVAAVAIMEAMMPKESKHAEVPAEGATVTPRFVLLKMRVWIETELDKATLPHNEPFVFTSLSYCASKIGAGSVKQEVLDLLHATVRHECSGKTCDAMRPHRALFLINRTLANLA